VYPVRVFSLQGRQQGDVSESKQDASSDEEIEPSEEEVAAAERILEKHRRWAEKKVSSVSNAIGKSEPSALNDPEYREQLLAYVRHIVSLYSEAKDALVRETEHLTAVLAKNVHESVQRAADSVSNDLSNSIKRLSWDIRILSEGVSAIEKSSSLEDAFLESPKELETMIDQVKYFHGHRRKEVTEYVEGLRIAVDAIEFAATADRNDELQKVKRAMADIQKGVTQLRMLGFEFGDVRAAVEDFIELRWQHDFKLTGRVVSDDNAKGSNRNNKTFRGKRERLLDEDKWVTRFLNEFWCRYWRNAFEQSLPQEEHSTNIEDALAVMPGMLDAEDAPIDTRYLCISAWSEIRKRREQEEVTRPRVRLRDSHVLKALDRLIQSAGSNPMGVVEIEGAVKKYWTRHRAEGAGLEIVPPRLRLVPSDGHNSEE